MTTTRERFMSKVAFDPGGCWLWTGTAGNHGYGWFRDQHRNTLAHRWAYEHFMGPIPSGLHIDHLCRTLLCVNPAHLEPVTPAENNRRAAAAITGCPHGHPYDEANTCQVQRSDGRTERQCRTCARERWRANNPTQQKEQNHVR